MGGLLYRIVKCHLQKNRERLKRETKTAMLQKTRKKNNTHISISYPFEFGFWTMRTRRRHRRCHRWWWWWQWSSSLVVCTYFFALVQYSVHRGTRASIPSKGVCVRVHVQLCMTHEMSRFHRILAENGVQRGTKKKIAQKKPLHSNAITTPIHRPFKTNILFDWFHVRLSQHKFIYCSCIECVGMRQPEMGGGHMSKSLSGTFGHRQNTKFMKLCSRHFVLCIGNESRSWHHRHVWTHHWRIFIYPTRHKRNTHTYKYETDTDSSQ